MVVHLPIGFLLLALIMELVSIFLKDKTKNLDSAIGIALLAGGIGGVGSVAIGLLLATGGGYEAATLDWHKWMGILVTILAFVAWGLKKSFLSISPLIERALLFGIVLGISITGHLGGNLTHGSDYLLAYAPDLVKKVAGVSSETRKIKVPDHLDSIVVFDHLVKPILESKCVSCHNPTKTQGGLLMTAAGLQAGGDSGPSLHGGEPFKSELFIRTTLPQSSKKFMPPKGETLSYAEIKLLEWWIGEGASMTAPVTKMKASSEVKTLLLRDFQLDLNVKPHYERVQLEPVSRNLIEQAESKGWIIQPLASGHAMLDVKFDNTELTEEAIGTLVPIAQNVAFLDLSDVVFDEGSFQNLVNFENLVRLKLAGSSVQDAELPAIENLLFLEVLNVYNTHLTENSLESIAKIKSLKKLYLWRTEIKSESLEPLKSQLSSTEIIG